MKRFVVLLVLSSLLLVPVTALSSGEKVVYALFSRGWPPFEMVVDGKPQGLIKDIYRASMPDDVDFSVEAHPSPRKLLYTTGEVVYTRLESRTWMKRRASCLWSAPVLSLESVLVSSSRKIVDYSGPKSIWGKTIGCIGNYTYPHLEGVFKAGKANRYDVNSNQVLIRMLKAGRVDAIVMDSIEVRWEILHMDEVSLNDFYIAPQPVDVAELRFAFSRSPGWVKRLPEINRRIALLREDGVFRRIMQQYK